MQKFTEPKFKGTVETTQPSEIPPQQLERELTPDELKEKLSDPHFLPTHEQITNAFTSREEWRKVCFDEEKPVFEFFNEEYLNAFADYFIGKIQEHGAGKEKPLVILEIGAGNGRLSHFLQQKLDKKAPGQTKVIATDSGVLALERAFPVEQLSHDEAMEKYSPDIVVCSWMPCKKDLSKDIRKFDSVQEYILIGEPNGGCCGDAWETWGKSYSSEIWGESWSLDEGDEYGEDDEENKDDEKVPPHKADGFERENLKDLSDLQICRTDELGDYFHSETVSFKRRK